MPVPSDISVSETPSGPAPSLEARRAAASADIDNLFDDGADAIEAPTPAPVVQQEAPKPKMVPAAPPTPTPVAVEEEAPVRRQPRILPAIPREEVEPEPEPVKVKPIAKIESEEEPTKAANADLIAALKEAFPQPRVPDKVETPVELSDEERDKILKVYKPAADLATRLANPETSAAAMQEMIDGVRNEQRTFAFQVAKELVAKSLQDRDTAMQQQQTAAQTAQQMRDQLYTSYPVLKDENMKGVVKAAALLLKSEGYVPKTADEMIKTLAERVEKEAKAVNPAFSLSSVPTKPNTTKTPKPTSSTPGGGKGGAAVRTEGAKAYTPAKGTEIFD